MEMEIKSWHVVEPLTRYDPPPEGGGDCNFCQCAQCRNPLWSERTRGNAVASPLAVIFLDGNNEPTISVGLCRFSPLWIRFISRALPLTVKYA